jgi:hypothetical protein
MDRHVIRRYAIKRLGVDSFQFLSLSADLPGKELVVNLDLMRLRLRFSPALQNKMALHQTQLGALWGPVPWGLDGAWWREAAQVKAPATWFILFVALNPSIKS